MCNVHCDLLSRFLSQKFHETNFYTIYQIICISQYLWVIKYEFDNWKRSALRCFTFSSTRFHEKLQLFRQFHERNNPKKDASKCQSEIEIRGPNETILTKKQIDENVILHTQLTLCFSKCCFSLMHTRCRWIYIST